MANIKIATDPRIDVSGAAIDKPWRQRWAQVELSSGYPCARCRQYWDTIHRDEDLCQECYFKTPPTLAPED